ncbi:hypothetical protein DCS_02033 [Drechmeria coniospora]|uniref:Retrotransposon gag domain-containing protein n=1 Tax=Drechmeria coniospora TaxID=98403 RepID=A0A151GUV2_DRECN|nr:hypothetical protein DCS_02033 [Drechmeria coniospora]KYK60894.1 hypothetical protein DCS_02033 [Drechmeria coniospora]
MWRVEGFWRCGGPGGARNPRDFLAYLTQTFGSVQDKEQAQDRLATLIQKEGQTLGAFLPDFEDTLTKAGGDTWGDDCRLAWLRNSLSASLREQLIAVEMPQTYSDYIKRLQTLAWNFERTARFRELKKKEARATMTAVTRIMEGTSRATRKEIARNRKEQLSLRWMLTAIRL